MIERLAIEQLRHGWKATLATTITLSLTLAFATAAMLIAATTMATQWTGIPWFDLGTRSDVHHGSVEVVFGDPLPSDSPYLENINARVSLDDVPRIVESAPESSSLRAYTWTVGTNPTFAEGMGVYIMVPYDASDMDEYLVRGRLPERGEIALGVDVADSLGLGVGDVLHLDDVWERTSGPGVDLTISGLLKYGGARPYDIYIPQAVASWGDVQLFASDLPDWYLVDDAAGTESSIVQIQLLWSGYSPSLAPYELPRDRYDPPDVEFSWTGISAYLDGPAAWALVVAGVAVGCLVAVALAMGRAQAEARANWTATARVLGATKRDIVDASLVEAVAVSLVSVGIGLVGGLGLANVHLAYLRLAHRDAILPAAISAPAEVFGVGAIVGLALALIVAVVPAFWATRVAPVAALKPVTPLREATLSREVKWWWPSAIAGGGLVVIVLGGWLGVETGYSWGGLATTLGQFCAVIAGVAVVVQLARGIVSLVSRRLSQSRRPALLAAGDGLLAHRRALTPIALGGGVVAASTSIVITEGAYSAIAVPRDWGGEGKFPFAGFGRWWSDSVVTPGWLVVAATAFAVVAIVAVAIVVAAGSTARRDDATRAALGLSSRDERTAAGVRVGFVFGTAVVGGAAAGWVIAVVHRLVAGPMMPYSDPSFLVWSPEAAAAGLVGAAIVAAIGLAAAGATGMIVARLSGSEPPVEAIRRTET